ncbi:hypothetical protein BKA64DRAFT_688095 [Cadophora sp. MPI-SDFR-AT-0126]|nr:hypothetical protein BKA64DRAFT_688095 [Leotiomycetes sp. MPI-SDFR-AT-0126]
MGSRHLCPICQHTFSRNDHLRRHLLTHTDLRHFVCKRCSRGFNRRDAFRRHIDTCTPHKKSEASVTNRVAREPLDQLVSVPNLVGEHELESQADQLYDLSPAPPWDHLISQMESDAYQESIRGGASKSLSIFFRTVSKSGLNSVFDPDFTLPASTASPALCVTTDLSLGQASWESTWDLPGSITMMDAGDATASHTWPWSASSDDENFPWAHETYGLGLDNASAQIEAIQATPFLGVESSSQTWTPPPEHEWSAEVNDCVTVSNEIISRLRSEICRKPLCQSRYPQEWSPQIANECYTLFGPSSLIKFIEDYWNGWYIHWPAIHRATFQISQRPATLVASLVLLATSYSSDSEARELARCWADVVESIVFTDEYFGSATMFSSLNAACLEKRLRALQAALAMCVYQAFEGGTIAMRRARRSRFSEVVDMGRELGFQNGRHTDLENVTKGTFSWKEFILKEELNRTLTYMLILDSSWGILYNSVPKIMVEELHTDLFCPEDCFQASTESECVQQLQAWVSHPFFKAWRMSFADAFKILSGSTLDSQTQQMFTQVGHLNLLVLTTALHSRIFYIRNSTLPLDPNSAVLNSMRNWRRIWTLRELMGLGGNPHEPETTPVVQSTSQGGSIRGQGQGQRWRQIGFMKDALQFWLLGQVMLDSQRCIDLGVGSKGSDNNNRIRSQFDQPCMSNLKLYLSKLDEGGGMNIK